MKPGKQIRLKADYRVISDQIEMGLAYKYKHFKHTKLPDLDAFD